MTASDEQVERLARAVYVSIDHDDDDWPDESPEYRRYWTDMATGFLAALPAAGLAVVGADARRAAEAVVADAAWIASGNLMTVDADLIDALRVALSPRDGGSGGDGEDESSSTP
jgi:hypothetical protein